MKTNIFRFMIWLSKKGEIGINDLYHLEFTTCNIFFYYFTCIAFLWWFVGFNNLKYFCQIVCFQELGVCDVIFFHKCHNFCVVFPVKDKNYEIFQRQIYFRQYFFSFHQFSTITPEFWVRFCVDGKKSKNIFSNLFTFTLR